MPRATWRRATRHWPSASPGTPPRSVSPTRGRCRWRWSLPPVADSIRNCTHRPARYQALQVATARGLPLRLVEDLLESHTERPLVGPAVVNVLALNMARPG
ncbi:potassium-transporting ATPase subunit C [Pseudomonas aeruginosa]